MQPGPTVGDDIGAGRQGSPVPSRPSRRPIRKHVSWRRSCCRKWAIWRARWACRKLEGMSRYLERFELTVQRVQQELGGLGSGVSDAAPTAQRLADSLEFLNQVMRGLAGEESGLALSQSDRRNGCRAALENTVIQRNQQFAATVRKAIGAAEPLSKAQIGRAGAACVERAAWLPRVGSGASCLPVAHRPVTSR